MTYRLLDAPLTRTWIGLARLAFRIPPLSDDWNWSWTWEQNSKNALPSTVQLQIGRYSVSVFFPFTLLLIHWIGRKLGGERLGWLAMVLLSLNVLVLLHTRRAMAEGILLMSILLSLWAFISWNSRPWMVAIPVALAVNSKQSAISLVLVALLLQGYYSIRQHHTLRKVLINILLFITLVSGITFILNPFLWSHPVQAAAAALKSRQELNERQVNEFGAINQDQVLLTLPDRILAVTANLFFTPPAIADVGNYLAQTEDTERFYLAQPMNLLFRGEVGGSVMLTLSLAGLIMMFLSLRQPGAHRILTVILLITGFSQFTVLLIGFSLPFQRYVIPLVPFACLSAAFGIESAFRILETWTHQKSR